MKSANVTRPQRFSEQIAPTRSRRQEFARLIKSYARLADLVQAREGAEAEKHWRRHMEAAGAAMLRGYEKTKVRDIMD